MSENHKYQPDMQKVKTNAPAAFTIHGDQQASPNNEAHKHIVDGPLTIWR